jgi:NAD-dependent SIR2 family protein deacetylase
MKLCKLREELGHKERTIGDLINFIQIRNSDKRPNYALFLGAGASVTSGINTGQQLVDTWRKEIYTRLTGNDHAQVTSESIIDYFKKEEGAWYNPNN